MYQSHDAEAGIEFACLMFLGLGFSYLAMLTAKRLYRCAHTSDDDHIMTMMYSHICRAETLLPLATIVGRASRSAEVNPPGGECEI